MNYISMMVAIFLYWTVIASVAIVTGYQSVLKIGSLSWIILVAIGSVVGFLAGSKSFHS